MKASGKITFEIDDQSVKDICLAEIEDYFISVLEKYDENNKIKKHIKSQGVESISMNDESRLIFNYADPRGGKFVDFLIDIEPICMLKLKHVKEFKSHILQKYA